MNNTSISAIEEQFFALNLARVKCNREFLRTLDKITDKLARVQHAERCELEQEYFILTEVYFDFKITDLNLLEIEKLKSKLKTVQKSLKTY